ncbi:hypothetical protein DYB34_012766 [Aphanomyces astaci]|uniref:Uncharacterized protein n=1 Tax=Aphanomyces astaci TaxID=112090 RepID=A0A418C7B0_APHAT|nr:hypothetical protein DYB34_012766 [Aphanomyces astaci]
MQQTEVATETMSIPVPAGVYGRAMASQKPFMPERPKQREPPEYIPQDSYGMRGHNNIGNANFPLESAVFILLNECEDLIVASCLRGGPTLPTTIEASLKYLKEKDGNLEKPFEGNPKTATVSPGTPGSAPRGLAKPSDPD